MGDDALTLGELGRAVARVEHAITAMRDEAKADRHELRNDLQKYALKQGEHEIRIASVEDDLTDMKPKVEQAATRAAQISGGIGALSFCAGLVTKWWKS